MANDNTVYLITGANKGIGHRLTHLLLQRPNTAVVAAVRAHALPTLTSETLPAHPTSILVPIALDDDDPSINSTTLASRLASAGITHLDTVIANAGGASGGFKDIEHTQDAHMLRDFEVNAVGPLRLFRATWPLLAMADDGQAQGKKFVLVTSSVGSIANMDEQAFPALAYGASKAAANWFAKMLSVEYKERGLAVGIFHPGWVKTDMGQGLADTVGVKEPPMTVEESGNYMLERIDQLNLENSGTFQHFNGSQIPW